MNAARFNIKTQRGCLCISEGNQLSSEMCHWHFHLILPIMPDKTAFMSVDRAAFLYSCSVRDFRAQSANHLFMFGISGGLSLSLVKGLIKLQKEMSFNKYERCTFQNQNAARMFMYL